MATTVDNIDATGAKAKPVSTFPTVYQWYGEGLGQEADQSQWVGGEMILYTPTMKFFIQTQTSGTTGQWKQLSSGFATTTSTSTSTSTSSSTSTSTSTSSTTTP